MTITAGYDDFNDAANAELTMEPIGPLADGSPGKTLTISRKDFYVYDVLVGN